MLSTKPTAAKLFSAGPKMLSTKPTAANLFSAGPRCPVTTEPIRSLIEVTNPMSASILDTHFKTAIEAYVTCKPRPNGHKVSPIPELLPCLRSV
ncbi:hypothetical protein DSO57_1037334 [Entomophthora muscae]|uniref:Uncharacterized protein n=1 Tax=Entomophthora muscae TaxID=34485 RepID=A0ACC2RPZ3_9FUNG|nr:hypothetical protein DSO57_1037334 [Entomophthora muscae]